jgi:uncharacterized protein YjiK
MIKHFIQTRCPLLLAIVLVYAITLQTGCKHQSYTSPEGYDMNKPEKMELGKELNEISGISYNKNDSDLLAISDSKKKIFEIVLKKHKLRDYTGDVVGPDQDLEDLVNMEDAVYLLSSKGVIYQVPVGDDTTVMGNYPFWSKGKNDFETLYYDPTVNGLIMMCKTCHDDKGKQVRSAYRFDLDTKKFDSLAFYSIHTNDVKSMVKDDDAKFDPSAAAIHPINKRLYILSSAGNLLVIADTRGKLIEAYHLNPDKFPQAEGIAFAPNGDMFISNEGSSGKSTLQIFPYHEGKKK